jgi:putative ABC transport system permease protein
MSFGDEMTMRYEDESGNLHIYEEDKIFLVDSNFFEIFNFNLLSG